MILSFDLDGTLVDSVHDLAHALNAALAELGRPAHSVERVRGFVGSGARNLVLRALTAQDGAPPAPALVDDVLERFRRVYGEAFLGETTVYEGIPAALDALRVTHTLAVATNKPGVFARPLVEALLPGRVALVVGPDDVGALKPSAQALVFMEQKLGDRVAAHIGDSPIDLETARRHGVPAVAVAWGLTPREELASADLLVEHPGELVDALGRLLRS